ncbi:MAG TPA: HEAT repeat domain-containing protein [Candidatus Binataceae bacterium]|nr:HEAT repeat domain-containing protein [Candidatus Binataceae bacterium]
MGRIVKSRIGLLIVGAALTVALVALATRSVVRWRNLRAVDRMVAAHQIPRAVDFVTSHFRLDRPDGWRALRHLSIAVLRQGLDDRDPYDRCYAATSLVDYGDWTGRRVIDASSNAKDLFQQKAVVEGLAEARDARAVELLRKFYTTGDRRLKSWTIEALAENGNHRALPLLLEATTSSNQGIKIWGIWGLGRLHDRRVVSYLRALQVKETDPLILAAIAHTLLALGDRTIGSIELIEAVFYDPNPDRASDAALELGDAADSLAVPQLKAALMNTELDLTIRLAAAVALTHYGNRDGLRLLQTVAADPYTNGELAPLLLNLNFNISRSLLISAMSSHNVVLQLAATEAIGRLGGRTEIGILTAALDKTSESFMTAQIAWSLGRLARPECIPPLVALLKSSNPTVRNSAADGLVRTTNRLLTGSNQ